MQSDEISTRPYLLKVGKKISALGLLDGTRIAVEARGEIFDVPVKGGTRGT